MNTDGLRGFLAGQREFRHGVLICLFYLHTAHSYHTLQLSRYGRR
jgi:hypothetical protein